MSASISPPSATTPITPGVVTGAAYKALIQRCHLGRYALPAVNVSSSTTANMALEAARRNRADIIIQISAGGAQFYAGRGLPDKQQAHILGAVALARHVHLLARHYGVAVILHTDHANRPLLGWLEGLIEENRQHYGQTGQPLFSSHMLDLSTEPLEQNIATAATLLQKLTPLGIGLEIELGITGGEEDGIGTELTGHHAAKNPELYTEPEDVLTAWKALSPLGMLSIAASFGNVHGVYKPGNVCLRPSILRDSQALIATTFQTEPNPVPLVFHGGSGSDEQDIRHAVDYGVFKLNIDTDTQFAYAQGVATYIDAHKEAFRRQVAPDTGRPLKHEYDIRNWMRAGEEHCIARLTRAFDVLGSRGKSVVVS
ncbi:MULTISPECIES: class II fructose-bisphosphate aldolase [Bombella]|uniref:Fructose-bisphosphate aldolase n=1 Tax=Bombella pollinis TaxID=2967337 RepID=A0ABT3WMK0_9PROT|nr:MULTISPECIES: class II fructose-bisphosphate aldolase [Bombella]MCX5620347.1 class II fructose-bisphosphate aldolase [Bombella pollinis]MUG90870.1 class II fructose-bisphosphate aldolase [Bombella sp. ESL0385]